MNIRYNTDPDTGLPHMYQHGVTEEEVRDVIRRPMENLPSDRNSRILIGRTVPGRMLKVICVPDDEGDGLFVVTAYDLAGKALTAHNRRMRKRGR